ncbi:ABC transporter substrate-binding protein [Actinoplanes sp. TBRC 11911]|uniref:peptide ABC transporter substrate-binding protein n=1 Tax=Actinoplanes sp. TBRC 11911 TaxID=2729386 RepID=UPI00145D90F5|nr:ABC transporter substrate-binding protein [Actinoplanes sp. TBRC 11911]NMO57021.1 ABC transporter substrate-binding protein [Actinoplanes sp. TBRC 11911]
MPGKSRWRMVAPVATIALLAAGCSGGDSQDTEALPNSISISIGEPQTLIPSGVVETYGLQVLTSLFYPLVGIDKTNKPYTMAADSITHDKSAKVWTIKLKDGFTFSNGEPVTADNYINAWNYAAFAPNAQVTSYYFDRIAGYADLQPDPATKKPPTVKKMSGLKKINNLTLQVTLDAPFIGFETVMSYASFYPLPKAAFSGDGVLNKDFNEEPIGNGPFKMTGKWQHDQKIQVTKVPDFKGTVPKVDNITWKIYQDLGAQYNDLISGNLDVDTKIPTESLGSASSDLGLRLQKSPSSAFQFIGVPTFEKDFSDPRVRRALSMAINRQEIADQIYLGTQLPATSWVSPQIDGYRANSCGDACEYNPTQAKKLYTQGGGPAEITISYNTDGGYKSYIDALCNQIKSSLGINCTSHAVPSLSELVKDLQEKKNVGLVRLAWAMDYPLMESYLGPVYTTTGSSNYSGYTNPTFDSLVKDGDEAKTPDEAIKKWQQAEDILKDDMPVIPVMFGQNVYGYSPKVDDVTMDLSQNVDIYTIDVAS